MRNRTLIIGSILTAIFFLSASFVWQLEAASMFETNRFGERLVPVLTIEKSGPADVVIGELITYSIDVKNSGITSATGVVVTDSVPAGATFAASPNGTLVGNVISWTIPFITATNGMTTLQFSVTASDTITNSDYRVSAAGGFATSGSTAVTTQILSPELAIDKTGPLSGSALTPFTYTLSISNTGTSTATNVVVLDALPAGSTYVGGGFLNGSTISFTLGTLPPASQQSVQFSVVVTDAIATPQVVNAIYSVDSAETQSTTGTTIVTTTILVPDLNIVKSAPLTTSQQTPFTYTLTISNSGTSTATNVIVTDQLPAGAQYVGGGAFDGTTVSFNVGTLAPNAQQSLQFSVVVTDAVATPQVINSVYAIDSAETPTTTGSSAVATNIEAPDLTITKSGPATVNEGSPFNYTLEIMNNGTVDATNVVITDVLPAGTTYVSGGNLNGNVVSFTIPVIAAGATENMQFTVTATDADNFATVTNSQYGATSNEGVGAVGTIVVNTSVLAPSLAIGKSGPATVVEGAAIQYTIVITNLGSGAATDIVITDTVPAGTTYLSGGTLVGNVVSFTVPVLISSGQAVLTFDVSADNATTFPTVTNDDYRAESSEGAVAVGALSVNTTVTQPELSISKSGPASMNEGDLITYTLTISNDGDAAASNLVVTDTLPAGTTYVSGGTNNGNVVNFNIGSLAANAQTTVQFTVLTAVGGGPTSVTNDTYSVSADGGYNATGTLAVTTTILKSSLSIVKSGPTSVLEGDNITYVITVTNNGAAPASNLVVVDTLPAGASYVSGGSLLGSDVSFSIPALAANNQTTVQFTVSADNAATFPVVTNDTYSVVATGGISATGSVAVNTSVFKPELNISKSGPSIILEGDPIVYVLTVFNSGTGDANQLIISDTLPTGTTYQSGGTLNNNVVNWTIPTLAPSSSAQVTLTVIANNATSFPTVRNDTYSVSSDDGSSATGSIAIVTTVTKPFLEISKSGPSQVLEGGSLIYTLAITNSGSAVATNLVITDVIPAGVVHLFGGISDGTVVSWNIPSLAAGANTNVVFTAAATDIDSFPIITNDNYGVRSDGGVSAVGSVAVNTTVLKPNLRITKSGPQSVLEGENFSYTLTITNQGNVAATNVVITDLIPAGTTYVSGGSLTSGVASWNIPSIASGSVAIVELTVFGVDADSFPLVTNSSYGATSSEGAGATGSVSVETAIVQPRLEISKSGPSTAIQTVPFDYTIFLTNTGTAEATDVDVTDQLPAGAIYISGGTLNGNTVEWTIPSIPAGSATSVNFSVRVQNAGATPAVTNDTYSATSAEGASTIGTNSITTNIIAPDLAISKSGPNSVNEGENIVYTLTINNFGNAPATNIVITDVVPVGAQYVSGGVLNSGVARWTIGSIPSNGQATVQLTVRVNDASAVGSITNRDFGAISQEGDLAIGVNSVTTEIFSPSLAISKSGPTSVREGDQILYSIVVENNGIGPVTNIVVEDVVPQGATYVSGGTLNNGVVSWAIPNLLQGTETTLQFRVTADDAETFPFVVNDDYSATADDGVAISGSVAVSTEVLIPELAISKSAASEIIEGQPLVYTLVITNSGNGSATSVEVTDALPDGTSYVSGGTFNSGSVSWLIPTIEAGATAQVSFTVEADNAFDMPVVINDDYEVTSAQGVSALGSVAVETEVMAGVILSITKSAETSGIVGDPLTYTLTIVNSGINAANGVVITDVLPTGADYVAGGSLIGNVVEWSIFTLPPNTPAEVQFVVTTDELVLVNDDYGVLASGGYSATGLIPVVSTFTTYNLFMPILSEMHIAGEENDTCADATNITHGIEYAYLPDDFLDWYRIDLTAVQNQPDLRFLVTNFAPLNGQITVFKGDNCGSLETVGNNGDFSDVKEVVIANGDSSVYYFVVVNDNIIADPPAYRLIVTLEN